MDEANVQRPRRRLQQCTVECKGHVRATKSGMAIHCSRLVCTIMYTINKKSLLCVTLLLHTHGVLSTDYIRGEYATCNAKVQPIRRIVWYHDYGGSEEQVTTWTDGSGPPSDSGQLHNWALMQGISSL